jgi:hypothetical protein
MSDPQPINHELLPASAERLRYASIINFGTRLSLALLIVTFVLYIFGLVPATVPRSEVVAHWHEPAEMLAETTGSSVGWAWAKEPLRGEHLPFVGLALLGVLTIIGYASLVPAYVAKKRWLYLSIVLVQIAVLVLAASSLIRVGGH